MSFHINILSAAALAVIVLAFNQPSARADAQDDAFVKLPPGIPVVDGVETLRVNGSGGTLELVPVFGQPFTKAVRIKTTVRPANPYNFQAIAPIAASLQKGDVMLAVFHARAVAPFSADGEARTEFVLELKGEPYTKSASYPVVLSTEWRTFYIPFEAALNMEPDDANAMFRAGYDPQAIEIGGFQVLNFKHSASRQTLPYTPGTYTGREPDAPWRKAAAERIEKFRKANLSVSVLNAKRVPLPDAEVSVRMKGHAFGFGTAVDAKMLLAAGPEANKYREVLQENFNRAVIENDLKWPRWENDRRTGLAAVQWLRSHYIDVRGHCLVWPGRINLPSSVIALFDQPDVLKNAVLNHVLEEASALKGQIVEWDVINEPFTNTDLQKILGDEILADCFKAARAADPGAKLFINDYSILESGGKDAPHQDHYEKTIRALLQKGAPVDGIGMQGHFNEDLTPVPRVIEILDRFAKLGLPIEMTEFDINTFDEAVQGDYTRDFLTAFFSHPSTAGFLLWGFWEKRHWIPNGAIFRQDWTLRPAAIAWRDLIFKQWWTSADGRTGKTGVYQVRGFHGEYEITVKSQGKTRTVPAHLNKEGLELEIILP